MSHQPYSQYSATQYDPRYAGWYGVPSVHASAQAGEMTPATPQFGQSTAAQYQSLEQTKTTAQSHGSQQVDTPAASPPMDLVETPDEILVLVDTPGFETDDIQIQVDDRSLIVSAERGDDDEEQTVLTRERPQRLYRVLTLPTQAVVEDAKASHENGVCRVTLPKSESQRRRVIGFE